MVAAASGYLTIQRITSQRYAKAWQLRLRYNDKPASSFTDLTSFVVMEEEKVADVLTNDRHFTQVNLGFTAVASLETLATIEFSSSAIPPASHRRPVPASALQCRVDSICIISG